MELRLFLLFILSAYLLNFLWESWHAYFLYAGYRGKSFKNFSVPEYLRLMGYVSFIDSCILGAMFLGGAFLWHNFYWYENMGAIKYFYFFAVTIGAAVWIEIRGVYLRKEWSYLPSMSKIFGLGLSPLAQLAITGLIALFVIS